MCQRVRGRAGSNTLPSTGVILAPPPSTTRGPWARSGDLLGCYSEGTGHDWHLVGGARDAAQYPTVHRMASAIRSYLAQSVDGAKVGKPCTK